MRMRISLIVMLMSMLAVVPVANAIDTGQAFEDPELQAGFEEAYGYPLAPPTTLDEMYDMAEYLVGAGVVTYGTQFAGYPAPEATIGEAIAICIRVERVCAVQFCFVRIQNAIVVFVRVAYVADSVSVCVRLSGIRNEWTIICGIKTIVSVIVRILDVIHSVTIRVLRSKAYG